MARYVRRGRLREWECGWDGGRGKTLSRTKSSKYSTIPTYTAPEGTRTAILATLKYIEEASRKWTKYESESSPKFSPFSLLSVSAWSLVVHTWKTAWVCVQLGYLPRMAEQNLTPFHQRINLKFGTKKRKTIRGGKKGVVHGKIRSTLNVYYIGRKMITRVYLLTTLCVIVVSRTSLIVCWNW